MVLHASERSVYLRVLHDVATYSVSCGWELPPRTTMLRTMTPVVGFLFSQPSKSEQVREGYVVSCAHKSQGRVE
jgi:hypothetical protein